MRVTIVTTTYNHLLYLKNFLNSLKNSYYEYDILVVDNNSNDSTIEYLSDNNIPYIKLDKNSGDGESNYIALKEGMERYNNDIVFKCDPDIYVFKEWDKIMIDTLRNIKGVVLPDWRWGYGWKWKNIDGFIEYSIALGTLFVTTRKILYDIDIYPRKYPYANAELELSIRLREKGYRIVLAEGLKVNHYQANGGLWTKEVGERLNYSYKRFSRDRKRLEKRLLLLSKRIGFSTLI